jgi:hypothetical protein
MLEEKQSAEQVADEIDEAIWEVSATVITTILKEKAKFNHRTDHFVAAEDQSSEHLALQTIKNFYMSGKLTQAQKAITHFNNAAYPGGAIISTMIPRSSIWASPYGLDDGSVFSIKLQCLNQGQEKARVLGPPGATVRAPGRFQDCHHPRL